MKRADVERAKAAGATLAVFTGYKPKRGGRAATEAREATVLSTQETRETYWGYGGAYGTKDGTRVKYVDDGSIETVGPQDLLRPWAEYVVERDAQQARERAAAQRESNELARAKAAVAVLGGAISRSHSGVGVKLNGDEAEELVGRVRSLVHLLADLPEGADGDLDVLRARLVGGGA